MTLHRPSNGPESQKTPSLLQKFMRGLHHAFHGEVQEVTRPTQKVTQPVQYSDLNQIMEDPRAQQALRVNEQASKENISAPVVDRGIQLPTDTFEAQKAAKMQELIELGLNPEQVTNEQAAMTQDALSDKEVLASHRLRDERQTELSSQTSVKTDRSSKLENPFVAA